LHHDRGAYETPLVLPLRRLRRMRSAFMERRYRAVRSTFPPRWRWGIDAMGCLTSAGAQCQGVRRLGFSESASRKASALQPAAQSRARHSPARRKLHRSPAEPAASVRVVNRLRFVVVEGLNAFAFKDVPEPATEGPDVNDSMRYAVTCKSADFPLRFALEPSIAF